MMIKTALHVDVAQRQQQHQRDRFVQTVENVAVITYRFKFRYLSIAYQHVLKTRFQGHRYIWDRGDTSPNIWTGGHYHECPPIFLE